MIAVLLNKWPELGGFTLLRLRVTDIPTSVELEIHAKPVFVKTVGYIHVSEHTLCLDPLFRYKAPLNNKNKHT